MSIPQKIAMQGVKVVEEYLSYMNRIETAQKQCKDCALKIKEIEKRIRKLVEEKYHWSYSHYERDKPNLLLVSYELEELVKDHVSTTLSFTEADNLQLSLREEMYYKRWLSDWEIERRERIGSKKSR
ncbi:hypothetical protein BEH_07605 [Priestia filamentosa]|uniref:Uncharacterized protein n=1 Tax=Priestia filamentosa TaxID=1402861 RepID=A0A0H4KEC8_9BACI|nr:hypothetical protein [Priestia filamentosa]AKO91975.1 hypothetical protein BEH_07605 [Priestia filamentosa]